jgi:hypothetical protein
MPSSTTPAYLVGCPYEHQLGRDLATGPTTSRMWEQISSDDAVRRLIARLGNPRRLRACCEAGPTGYELCRRSRAQGA